MVAQAAQPVSHVESARQYAKRVVSGKVVACKWVRLACERHLSDLKRSRDKGYAYKFDAAKAERVCRFAELMPHVKGEWARVVPGRSSLIVLEPWQRFVLCMLFGWVRKSDGLRRFRRAYLEIARKNGKSVLGAIIGLWMFACDGEAGAEVYSGATSEKQAWEVFRPARLMAEKTPEFLRRYKVSVGAKNLHSTDTGSRFEPVIGKPGDGASPHCAIVDEYHEHQTADLYDTMQTGMGARSQPLMLVITTAGDNLAGPCYDLRTHATQLLDGIVDDDELFAIIYTVDEESEWLTEAGILKANPNFGVSVGSDYLRSQVAEGKTRASRQGAVKTKHFNLWVQARNAYFNMEAWKASADPDLKRGQFIGQRCELGLDLASKVDLAACVAVFPEVRDGKLHYTIFGDYWIPEESLAGRADAMAGWAARGVVTATEGNEIDFAEIEEHLAGDGGLLESHDVSHVVFDPWQATQLRQNLQRRGATVLEFRNTVENFSPAMKELDAAILSGRVHHNGCPALTWMMANVVARVDAKENVYPRKNRPEDKIDGAVALIMGVAQAMKQETPAGSVYESRGLLAFGWEEEHE